MSEIIKISEDIIIIGTDDGGTLQVNRSDFNFEPKIGDDVKIFKNEEQIYVSKVEKKDATNAADKGININIQNSPNMDNNNNMVNNNTNNNIVNSNNNQVVYQSGKVVNKAVYLLLTFFLGGIGVHKFYIGRPVKGVLYFLFCWSGIPALLAFISFITGCFKKADAYGNIVI